MQLLLRPHPNPCVGYLNEAEYERWGLVLEFRMFVIGRGAASLDAGAGFVVVRAKTDELIWSVYDHNADFRDGRLRKACLAESS